MRLGIIGGTGVAPSSSGAEDILVETAYGDVAVHFWRSGSLDIFFLDRHQRGGTPTPGSPAPPPRPAHVVDHRANVDALARCNVDRVIALNSVGALDPALAAGALVTPDDYLDMRAKKLSFHDDAPVHVDVTEAYCPETRAALLAAGAAPCGPYASTEGPRLETRAEVRALRQLGGAVVGMTGATEAALARERCLCYASLCMVTNPAAGIGDARPTADEIRRVARDMAPRALALALDAASRIPTTKGCGCARALDAARL